MKFATFDLEIAKGFPDGGNWQENAPLGITCAALGKSDEPEPKFFQAVPSLSRAQAVELVQALQQVVADGYTLVTWSGTAFDFAVLAQESGLAAACAELALNHVDLMLIVTFKRGHWLALDKALIGAGIPGKLHEVTLNDGSQYTTMSGKDAPAMWAKGEYNAVLAYLREDVMPLLELAAVVQRTHRIEWTSNRGVPSDVIVSKLCTVRECFAFPLPDTSWMKTDPPQRSKFVDWMPPLDEIIPDTGYTPRSVRELPLFRYGDESDYWREFRSRLVLNETK